MTSKNDLASGDGAGLFIFGEHSAQEINERGEMKTTVFNAPKGSDLVEDTLDDYDKFIRSRLTPIP